MEDEFLENVYDRGGSDTDGSIFERKPCAVAISFRDVQIRDASRGDVAENAGIVWLPALIVSLTNEGAGDGIQEALALCASSLVEVARVLLEERWQDGASEE